MGSKPPSTQTVTQKTEIDPIQKSFLFGTPLPADYKAAMEARNREIMGVEEPMFETPPVVIQPLVRNPSDPAYYAPENQARLYGANERGRANGGIVALAGGGMVPSQMPDLSNRETAYLMGLQALQGATQPQMGYALGGLIEGPGTGTSDDIPATIYQDGIPVDQAFLSNGEVVLSRLDLENMAPDGNADTAAQMVGNSPNGTRGQAAAEMYAMTEMFRNGGRV